MENYKQQIGSKRRNFLMLWTVILVVLLGVGSFYFIPSANYVFSDPIMADYNSIYTYGLSPEKVQYVINIEPDNIYTFQTVYMEGETITEYFVGLVNEEGYFVLAELSAADFESETLTELSGYFAPLDEEVKDSIIDDLMQLDFTYEDAAEIMPSNLFKVDDKGGPLLILLVGLVILFILLLVTLMAWLTFNLDRYLAKKLAKYGDVDQLSKVLEMTPINFQHPDVALTSTHVFLIRPTGLKAIKNDELLWAYKFIQKRKSLVFITVSKTYSLVLNTMNESLSTNMPQREVDAALESLSQKMPWLVCTFSDDLKKMYKKERDGFQQMVMQRKNEFDLESE